MVRRVKKSRRIWRRDRNVAGFLAVHGPTPLAPTRRTVGISDFLLKESGEDGPWILFHLRVRRPWTFL